MSTQQLDTVSGVIQAIARGPDLERVLPAVVELLTEASSCHACFIYLREGDRLRIRAASGVFAHVVGRVDFGIDEGLTGWVARHRTPAFIRENALADPRMKLVPELDEEQFQSMVAVPLERGDHVIGVVVLHTEAPREFEQDVLDLLMTVATLISGAIDNARLYDDGRRQIAALRTLTELGRALAATTDRAALDGVVRSGVARMLDGARATLHVGRVAADAVVHDPTRGHLAITLETGTEMHGVLTATRERPFREEDAELLGATAAQLAVAIERAQLIDHLRDENHVRELFDALRAGDVDLPDAQLGGPFAIAAITNRPDVETGLRASLPGVLCADDGERVHALVPLTGGQVERLDAVLAALAERTGSIAGRSDVHRGAASGPRALREATDALRLGGLLHGEGALQTFRALGPYRFLTSVGAEEPPDARHAAAVATLRTYDDRRGTPLRATLERYLAGREGIVPTARALQIHPNTLRQRLERVEELTGLVLAEEDLLSLELTLKLERLRPPHR